jgi:lipopolysaccharide biosynthesis glycosyltransferase
MQKIVLACACDDAYSPYCGTMITSVFSNNREERIEVIVLTSDIGEDNKKKFDELASEYDQVIHVVYVNPDMFKGVPLKSGNSNLTKEAYYRLLLPEILPDTKTILYLDCDLIVRAHLRELWETDIEGCAFACVKDRKDIIEERVKTLGYPQQDSYFNSGVVLMNLEFLRGFGFSEKAFAFISSKGHLMKYVDQCVINAVCHGYFRELPVKWNMIVPFFMKLPPIVEEQRENLEQYISNPFIIHYTTEYKPWFKECIHPYKSEYWKYQKLSPWHNHPIQQFHGFKRLSHHYAKTTIKYILGKLGDKRFVWRDLALENNR